MKHKAYSALGLVVLAGLAVWACSGSNPTTPLTPPSTVAAAPSPSPAPAPSTAPSTAPVGTKSCSVPPNESEKEPVCTARNAPHGVYYNEVTGAIEIARQRKPEYFDGALIRQPEKYMLLVAEILETEYGICVERGGRGKRWPQDELALKTERRFAELYDVMSHGPEGEPYIYYGYTVTCIPPLF